MWGLKSVIKIMENRLHWWHPSCRHASGFSVSWIFVCLHGGRIQRRKEERELSNAHWNIRNLGFFSLSSLTKNISPITGKPHSSFLPCSKPGDEHRLKLCRLFWVILLQCMSSFSETGHPPFAGGCSLSPPGPLLDLIPHAAASASASTPTAACTSLCSCA